MGRAWFNQRSKNDLIACVLQAGVWNALALSEIRSKYRLSTFGSLWITLTTGALALSIGLIYGQFFGQDIKTYLPYFVTSYVTWSFIASVISESSQTLIGAGNLIKSSPMPIVFHVLRMLQRNLVIAGHNAIVIAAMWPFVQWNVGWEAVLSIFGVAMLYLFLAGLAVSLSIVCVRYRDIPPLVQIATQFLFFVTPIMWYPEALKFGAFILRLNPIAYFLMIVRDPLLGRPISPEVWPIAVALTFASLAAGILMYLRFRDRVAYWV